MATKKVSTIPPPDDLVNATIDAHRATPRAPSTTKQNVRIVVKIRNGPGSGYTGKGYVDLTLDHGMPAQEIAEELGRLVTNVGLHMKSTNAPDDKD